MTIVIIMLLMFILGKRESSANWSWAVQGTMPAINGSGAAESYGDSDHQTRQTRR